MAEILIKILGISVLIGIPSTSFLTGLHFGKPHLRDFPMHMPVVFRYSLIMFILMPAIAVILHFADSQHKVIWSGIFLVCISPVMPMLVAKSDSGLKSSRAKMAWYIIALVYSVVLIPLILFVVREIFSFDFKLGIEAITMKLVLMFMLPMFIAFFLSANKKLAKTAEKIIDPVNKIAMIVLILCLLIIAIPAVIEMGALPIVLVAAFVIAAFLIGIFGGWYHKKPGTILASSLLLRLPAPAIVFAQTNGTLKEHLPVILCYVILGVIVSRIADKKLPTVQTEL